MEEKIEEINEESDAAVSKDTTENPVEKDSTELDKFADLEADVKVPVEKGQKCKRVKFKNWQDGYKEKEIVGIVESENPKGTYFRETGKTSNKRYLIPASDLVSMEDTDEDFNMMPL